MRSRASAAHGRRHSVHAELPAYNGPITQEEINMCNLKLIAASALALGLLAGSLQADEIVTTASGRSVLLKDDGTWIENKTATQEARPQNQSEAAERIIQST